MTEQEKEELVRDFMAFAETKLNELEECLADGAEATLIIRVPDNPLAYAVVSNDNLIDLSELLLKEAEKHKQ